MLDEVFELVASLLQKLVGKEDSRPRLRLVVTVDQLAVAKLLLLEAVWV